ncbi:unnamed protein product [Cylindrotheca closterium]|uniref:Uncharacterized protein n=1 Tax=Cylindrotheca closterium TaxID=2856 RepID=A0AAD2FFS6_9STRA|nr:unnamed protein product [Cylindrotheca closterium]
MYSIGSCCKIRCEPQSHSPCRSLVATKQRIATLQLNKYNDKMTPTLDAGKASHSPSSEFMTLVDVDHMSDFSQVVDYLKKNLDNIIKEVHGFDKLLIDNEKTQLNCPPAPEAGDTHGSLLIRTLSEKEGPFGLTLKREFKVHDCGVDPDNASLHKVEIREDVVKAPSESGQPPIMTDTAVIVSINRL